MNVQRRFVGSLAAVTSLVVPVIGVPSVQAQALPPGAPIGLRNQRGGERHPELRRALRALERTEAALRRSARDFGGHREKAADLCHQAEGEIQQALQSDRQ